MAAVANRQQVVQAVNFDRLVPRSMFRTRSRRCIETISGEIYSLVLPVCDPTSRQRYIEEMDNQPDLHIMAQRELRTSNRKRSRSSLYSEQRNDVPHRKEYPKDGNDDVIMNGDHLADISRISNASRSRRRTSCDYAMDHFLVTMTSSPAFTSSRLNSTFNYPLHSTLRATSSDVEQNSTLLIQHESTIENARRNLSSSVALDSADDDVTVEPEGRRRVAVVVRSALFGGQLRDVTCDKAMEIENSVETDCGSVKIPTGNEHFFNRAQHNRRPIRLTSSKNRMRAKSSCPPKKNGEKYEQLVPGILKSRVQPVCRVHKDSIGQRRHAMVISKPEVESRRTSTGGILARQTGLSRLVPETVPLPNGRQDGHRDDVIVHRRTTNELKRRIKDYRREMIRGRISDEKRPVGLKVLGVV